MLIRRYEIRDEDRCLSMGKALLAESSLHFLPFDDKLVRHLLMDSIAFPEMNLCLVAEEDSELIGYFYGSIQYYYFCYEKMAADLWVYVCPEHRGSRAATGFIKKFNTWAQNMGVREIMVSPSTGIQTDRTVSWLKHLGFKVSGVMTKRRT